MISPREVAAYWYRLSDTATPIAQGDQFWGIDLFDAYVDDAGAVCADRLSVNLVVLTQSCDLEHEKVRTILAAPMYSLDDWLQVNPLDLARLEDIRRGYDPSLYLLPAWPDATVAPARSDRIVDLGELRVITHGQLRSALDAGIDRVALSSPAREHFSQAVARTFMRVGLPADIPSFELKRLGEDELLVSELSAGLENRHLKKPLRVSRKRYHRVRTGDTYWTLTTKGHQPPLLGAGCGESQALASLANRFAYSLEKLRDGDSAWAWLDDYTDR